MQARHRGKGRRAGEGRERRKKKRGLSPRLGGPGKSWCVAGAWEVSFGGESFGGWRLVRCSWSPLGVGGRDTPVVDSAGWVFGYTPRCPILILRGPSRACQSVPTTRWNLQ